jgi:hypothetical protein
VIIEETSRFRILLSISKELELQLTARIGPARLPSCLLAREIKLSGAHAFGLRLKWRRANFLVRASGLEGVLWITAHVRVDGRHPLVLLKKAEEISDCCGRKATLCLFTSAQSAVMAKSKQRRI